MKYWYTLSVLCLTVITTVWPSTGRAQDTAPAMLLSSSLNMDQDFGGTLDIDGSVAVIGAAQDDDGLMIEQGSAYVFRYDGDEWIEEGHLLSATPSAFNWFGTDVAVSGDIILVSEVNGDELTLNAGNVNIYRYTGGVWGIEAILTPPRGIVGESFGSAVDVDGKVAAIGASTTVGDFADQGAVYVYRNSGSSWDLEDTLRASDPGVADLFGASLSVDGNRIMVGAFNAADSTSNQAGKAYIFEYDGENWNETAILQSNRSNSIANMAASVSLRGDWAVSGVPLDNQVQAGAGSAIVHHYDGGGWNFHSKLTASDGRGFYLFGTGVAVEDTLIVVGAENWAEPGESSTGKVYVFSYDAGEDEWVESDGFVHDNAGVGDKFGSAVTLDGAVILAGAPDFGGPGAAYAYGAPKETTAVGDELPVAGLEVSAPYPNPFSGRSLLTVASTSGDPVRVALYDVLGREVQTLFHGRPSAERQQIEMTADNLSGGLYFVRVESVRGTIVKAVMISR